MAGSEPVPLIVLPGALGPLEGAAWDASLGGERTVLTATYASDDTLAALIGRVLALADAAGAARFDLLGQSYGGWIAQCVARARPERVRRLVLAHSFTLEPRHAWRFRLGRAMLRRMPRGLAAALLNKRAARALAPVRARDPARHARLVAELGRRVADPGFWDGLVAQQLCLQQSLEPPFATLAPLSDRLEVLVIEGADDPLLAERERAALRARHRRARVVRFDQAGHVSALVEPEAFRAAVLSFLTAAEA